LDIQKGMAKGHLTRKLMTSKRKSKPNKGDPRQVTASAQAGRPSRGPGTHGAAAKRAGRPATLTEYTKGFGDLELPALIKSLSDQSKAVIDGDLSRAETMLSIQVHTLDAIFNYLARRAINAEYMKNLECYLKFALRAQSQCLATWDTLAAIKHPPVLGYVNQANIAHGPQQVNNAAAPVRGASRARENENLQNEALTAKDGETLDTLGTTAASGIDPAMATMGAIDRPKNTGR
jgi:hypothetical protein